MYILVIICLSTWRTFVCMAMLYSMLQTLSSKSVHWSICLHLANAYNSPTINLSIRQFMIDSFCLSLFSVISKHFLSIIMVRDAWFYVPLCLLIKLNLFIQLISKWIFIPHTRRDSILVQIYKNTQKETIF